MSNPSLVYLSGPISGCTFGECTDWREYVNRAFPSHIQGISPMRAKHYLADETSLDGSYEQHPLSTERGINTRDHYDTLRSEVILVNLLGCTKDNPKSRISIGTVAEMAWAWDHGIPQVVAMEPGDENIHYHPMLNQWIDYKVPTLDEAIETVISIISPHEKFMYSNIGTLKLLAENNKLDLRTPLLYEIR